MSAMHARIEQLLSLRDGEPVDAQLQQHVSACAQCAAELRRLSLHRDALQSLPQMPAPDAWGGIQSALQASPKRSPMRTVAALGALFVLAIVLFVATRQSGLEVDDQVASTIVQPQSQLVSLQERSHALEQALRGLPERPAVERAGTAATIDGLQQRIGWLDQHLSGHDGAELDEAQTAQLWQERVALLDTLVRVRYAESGAYVF
jgi:hypothetical protein